MKNRPQTEDEIMEALARPFPPEEIEWRAARCGVSANNRAWVSVLAYLTSRAVMNRLDETVGIGGWQLSQEKIGDGFIAKLSLKINGEWVSKMDGAEMTDIEGFKGGLSSALKRSAVLFGIGRYLYHLEDGFAEVLDKKERNCYTAYDKKTDKEIYWMPPQLPEWALPSRAETAKIVTEATVAKASALKEKLERREEKEDSAVPGEAKKEPSKARTPAKSTRPKNHSEGFNSLWDLIQEAQNINQLKDIWLLNNGKIKALAPEEQRQLEIFKDAQKILFGSSGQGSN